MPTAVEETIEVDDRAQLHAVTEGQGRPVVLCHGGPGGTDTVGPLAALVSDVARVHRYDQRACGRSSGGPPFTMARWVADLDTLRGHWGHRRWVVGGHSFGAALALAYALEHPEHTEAVIYLSCVVRLHGQPDWYEQYRRVRLERIPPDRQARFLELRRRRDEHGGLSPDLAADLRSLALRTEFGHPERSGLIESHVAAELTEVNDDVNRALGVDFERYFAAETVLERLPALEVPVLLVHGEWDPRPVGAVAALAGELPHAELVTLPGVGHFPYREAPDALSRVLQRFLQSLPGYRV